MLRQLSAALVALALTACGDAPEESDNPAPVEASPPAVEAAPPVADAGSALRQCVACHSTEPGQHKIGPSLAGIFGRPAGTVPGYSYSAAMKASGLTWDEATLDRYLDTPIQTVPGTKMVFAGLKNPEKRAAAIAALKAL